MKTIKNQTFGEERALYNSSNLRLENCAFDGEEDGESALKECKNIQLENCYMNLRYPFWHIDGLKISASELTENCRAALWYDRDVKIYDTSMNGIKALRECSDIRLEKVKANSPEFCWRSRDIYIKDSAINSQYGFFESCNIRAEGLDFSGKYSFQYTRNLRISRSVLDTKDAFWHAKNVVVRDSVVKGEYLGWYSDGLTFINCRIIGTQPLCYCKNLRLTDCTMEDCDLAFEYSDVRADINGKIVSVKNPLKGQIVADEIGEIVRTSDSIYPVRAKIATRA